jgi:hypothetical protein
MRRAPLLLLLVALALGVATGLARAARRGVVPVLGATACKTRPPVLLRPGRSPRSPLRLDLAKMANTSQTMVDIESITSKTLLRDGTSHPTTGINTFRGVIRAGAVTQGHLPLTNTLHLSGSSYPTSPTVTVKGYIDALGGGAYEGTRNDDRFPSEPVGIGATWRVVKCDDINQTPAQETRTYTLRSISRGVAEMTFRDVVTIDPAHLDLGSQKNGTQVVRFKLVTLRGSAAGSQSVPLARGAATTEHSVTKVDVAFRATSASGPSMLIHVSVVDTDRSIPSS